MWPDQLSSQRLGEIIARAQVLAAGDVNWNRVVNAATKCSADSPHGAHMGTPDEVRAGQIGAAHDAIMIPNPVFTSVFDPLNHGGGGGGAMKKKPKQKPKKKPTSAKKNKPKPKKKPKKKNG